MIVSIYFERYDGGGCCSVGGGGGGGGSGVGCGDVTTQASFSIMYVHHMHVARKVQRRDIIIPN